MSGRYAVKVVNPTGALEGPRFVAVCHWPECGWHNGPHVVKAAAEEQARWHRHVHQRNAARGQAGSATTAGVLLFLIFGGLLFLALLHTGQQAMCALHDDALRYCGATATTPEETP